MKTLYHVSGVLNIKASNLPAPRIVRVTEFTDESAQAFTEAMGQAHNTGQDIIPVVIDSYGGDVYSLLSMISAIENSHLPVVTIAIGKAMSAGAVLLSYGVERFADQNADIMFHDMVSVHEGKTDDVVALAKHSNAMQKRLFEKMAKNCGQPKSYFINLLRDNDHTDIHMTPAVAKKHGIVTEVRVPDWHVYIPVSMMLQ